MGKKPPPESFHPYNPPKIATLFAVDGSQYTLPLYFCDHNDSDYFRCNICGGYVRHVARGKSLDQHLTSPGCAAEVARRDRQREAAKAAQALQELQNRVSGINQRRAAENSPAPYFISPAPILPPPIPSTSRLLTDGSVSHVQINPMSSLPPSSISGTAPSRHSSPEHQLGRDPDEPDYFDEENEEGVEEFMDDDSADDDDFMDHRQECYRPERVNEPRCAGQRIQWPARGPIWWFYAYAAHGAAKLSWIFDYYEKGHIIIHSRWKCTGYLESQRDIELGVCSACIRLRYSIELARFVSRAQEETPKPNTPWMYLNYNQLRNLLQAARKKNAELERKVVSLRKMLGRANNQIDNLQRSIVLISQNRISGVSRILSAALRNGRSAEFICDQLQLAISAIPGSALKSNPKARWTDLELDTAFLVKALGGARLLYALQKAERYPSASTLRTYKYIPELVISTTIPSEDDIIENLRSIFGAQGRAPLVNILVGLTLMMDGVALEEILRYDFRQNCIVGLCREHSGDIKKTVDSVDDIYRIANALKDGHVHKGKDATVAALAPVTDPTNYRPSPILLSPSCKAESGDKAAEWVKVFLETYHNDPNGEKKHGPICILATDGEAAFRKLRYTLGLTERLPCDSPLGKILYNLPGLNLFTGPRALITTADPKHVIKRFATLIRSSTHIQIGDTFVTSDDCLRILTFSGMTREKARDLLDPVDKQNVPKAVTLLETLHQISTTKANDIKDPQLQRRAKRVAFLTTVLTYFLDPFIKTKMTLSEQIRSLSTYSHLITALYCRHRGGFLSSALFADSQAVVKSILFSVARLQTIDKKLLYHIILEGTDRLEGVFSHARTQDHARNFDILQLAQKLNVGAEINAIMLRYPHLDRGHLRRNLVNVRGVDHVNPKSWEGDVCVGNVNVEQEYLAGKDDANRLLTKFGGVFDFDTLFADPHIDHLRPTGAYVGSRAADGNRENDDLPSAAAAAAPTSSGSVSGDASSRNATVSSADDDGILHGSLMPEANISDNGADADDAREMLDVDETAEEAWTEDELPEIEDDQVAATTNSGPEIQHSAALQLSSGLNPVIIERNHYLVVNGSKRHKPALVSQILNEQGHGKKVLLRTQRAAGVTIESALRRASIFNFASDSNPEAKRVETGDIGAILVRAGNNVCLAICEALAFRTSSSKPLSSITIDDLGAEGTNAITISIQLLDLRQFSTEASRWFCPGSYIQIHELGKDEKMPVKRHYIAQIPGKIFNLFPIKLASDSEGKPIWTMDESSLQDTLAKAWDSLDPESDNILLNLESLPMLSTLSLPYKDPSGANKLFVVNPTVPASLQSASGDAVLSPLTGASSVPCHLCGRMLPLSRMRNHVGRHILRALYNERDHLQDGKQIGMNPCGWCGLEGCKTYFLRQGKKISTTSNCAYQLKTMKYASALKVTDFAPCTNVPIHCELCASTTPSGGQPATIWKYNFLHHLTFNHIDTEGDLPPLTLRFLSSTHISVKEAEGLGVVAVKVREVRDMWGLPGSDAFGPPEALAETVKLKNQIDRKRAISSVSKSSSGSGGAPFKTQRR